MDQDASCTEVGLDPGGIVLDGDSASRLRKGVQHVSSSSLGYWTTRGYANSRIANSRTGRLADWTSSCPVRELAYPRVVQLPLPPLSAHFALARSPISATAERLYNMCMSFFQLFLNKKRRENLTKNVKNLKRDVKKT